jgi:type VI secretion system secreted protein Hcp
MAVDSFLEFDPSANIKGESLDSQHGKGKGDCLQIDSYSFSAEVPASAEQGQGLGAGKMKFNEFAFKTKASTASFAVYKNLTLGTHIPQAKLYLRKSGGGDKTGQKDYMVYTFKQLIITKYSIDGGSEDPVEDMAFAYTSLHVEYRVQDSTGKVTRAGSWGYDLKANLGTE